MTHSLDTIVLAYLDPGSGSLLFQAAVGALMAGTLAAKVYWRRIKALFSRGGTSDEVTTRSRND